MVFSVFLALLPVLLVGWLLLFRRTATDIAGGAGLLVAILVAILYFHTAPSVVASSVIAGAIGSLTVGLVLSASLLQIFVMQQSGALARVIAFMKGLAPGQKAVQVLLINMAFGVLLTALGAATVSIIPPILLALGYTASAAILLPAIGYTGMCIYALLGIPGVVFASFCGLSLYDTGILFAKYMPLTSLAVGLCMLYITGGMRMVREGLIPVIVATLAGGATCVLMAYLDMLTITGIIAGAVMSAVLLLYVRLRGLPLFDKSKLNEADLESERKFSLLRACSPWIVLIIASLLVNIPFLPFFKLTFKDWAMPIAIIPGAPELLRPFWQAWFWVFVSTFLCLPMLRITKAQMKTAWTMFCKRSWRVILSTAIFFALAYVMNHSGKDSSWILSAPEENMIKVIAMGAVVCFGKLYPVLTPLIGVISGFIGGSQTSGIAMFTTLHLAAAQNLATSGALLATASGMGSGIASIVSPVKLLAAAVSINKPEELPSVMRTGFIMTFLITVVCSVITYFLL